MHRIVISASLLLLFPNSTYMKIAILTLPLHTNYGGILQAYALQTVLERMGHQVEVLQKKPIKREPGKMLSLYCKRMARKLLKDWNTEIFIEQRNKREHPIIRQHTNKFIERHINLREINSLHEIAPTDYDVIITGSDQIWRKPYFCGMWDAPIKDVFLDFTKDWDIKRISYAASFGIDNITGEFTSKDIEDCKSALGRFNAVSVREDSGVRICEETFSTKAVHVVDPTMLLDKDDYINIVKNSEVPVSLGDMLCYILDPNPYKQDVIAKISKDRNLTPFNVYADVYNRKLPVEERIQPPLESWLRGFMDAKFIVTDSFHACAFSIIFGKPFIAIGNAKRGMDRFTSLLKTFNLENLLLAGTEKIDNIHSGIEDASYDLRTLKKFSLNFLTSNV